MIDDTSMKKYLNTFNTLINQMNWVRDSIRDKEQYIFLLYNLPDKWDNMIIMISGITKIIDLNIDHIIG